MKKILSLLLISALLVSSIHASPPGDPQPQKFLQVQKIYLSQVNVSEQPAGSNWGPEIKMYLASVNVHSPAPWCAAFVHWCLVQANVPNTITAYSPTAHNSKNLVYFKGTFYQEPRAADVGTLYFPSLRRIAHTFFFDGKLNKSIYRSVEGNTNSNGSREGTAVLIKYRSFKATYSISRWT